MKGRSLYLTLAVLSAAGASALTATQAPTPVAEPAKPCGGAPSVGGTVWTEQDTGNMVVTFHFEANGTFIYRMVIGDNRSTWTQTGDCIRFDDETFLYEGRILGDEMEGTSRFKDRPDSRLSPWRARLSGGRRASSGPSPLVRRAFEPGGPDSLVRTGRADYTRVEEGEIKSFSFTTGPSGKLLGAGADREKTTTKLYEVSLFLDEGGARQALAKFKAKDLAKQITRAEIHDVVLAGAFDKLLLLRFSRNRSAREMRQDFAESLGARVALTEPGVDEFMKCIGRDFVNGDEVVLRTRLQTLKVETAGEPCAEIANPAVSRAVVAIWIGKGELSGQPGGLLSAAGPLMKQ